MRSLGSQDAAGGHVYPLLGVCLGSPNAVGDRFLVPLPGDVPISVSSNVRDYGVRHCGWRRDLRPGLGALGGLSGTAIRAGRQRRDRDDRRYRQRAGRNLAVRIPAAAASALIPAMSPWQAASSYPVVPLICPAKYRLSISCVSSVIFN